MISIQITGQETVEGLLPLLGECLVGWKNSRKGTERSAAEAVRATLSISLQVLVLDWPRLALEECHQRQLGVLLGLVQTSLQAIEAYANADKGAMQPRSMLFTFKENDGVVCEVGLIIASRHG